MLARQLAGTQGMCIAFKDSSNNPRPLQWPASPENELPQQLINMPASDTVAGWSFGLCEYVLPSTDGSSKSQPVHQHFHRALDTVASLLSKLSSCRRHTPCRVPDGSTEQGIGGERFHLLTEFQDTTEGGKDAKRNTHKDISLRPLQQHVSQRALEPTSSLHSRPPIYIYDAPSTSPDLSVLNEP